MRLPTSIAHACSARTASSSSRRRGRLQRPQQCVLGHRRRAHAREQPRTPRVSDLRAWHAAWRHHGPCIALSQQLCAWRPQPGPARGSSSWRLRQAGQQQPREQQPHPGQVRSSCSSSGTSAGAKRSGAAGVRRAAVFGAAGAASTTAALQCSHAVAQHQAPVWLANAPAGVACWGNGGVCLQLLAQTRSDNCCCLRRPTATSSGTLATGAWALRRRRLTTCRGATGRQRLCHHQQLSQPAPSKAPTVTTSGRAATCRTIHGCSWSASAARARCRG